MAKIIHTVAAFAVAAGLAGCGAASSGGGGAVPVSQGPAMLVKGRSPAALYSDIARQVRACWLNPADPVLTNHQLRAEAGAGGPSGSETKIVIYQRTTDSKLGLKAYTIDFKPSGNKTRIVTRNHKLAYALAQKLDSDVGYWAQGGANCDGPAAIGAAAPRGSIAGPRVTQ